MLEINYNYTDEYLAYFKVLNELNDEELKVEFLDFVKDFVYYTAKEDGVDDGVLADVESQRNDLTVSDYARQLGFPHFGEGLDDLLILPRK